MALYSSRSDRARCRRMAVPRTLRSSSKRQGHLHLQSMSTLMDRQDSTFSTLASDSPRPHRHDLHRFSYAMSSFRPVIPNSLHDAKLLCERRRMYRQRIYPPRNGRLTQSRVGCFPRARRRFFRASDAALEAAGSQVVGGEKVKAVAGPWVTKGVRCTEPRTGGLEGGHGRLL